LNIWILVGVAVGIALIVVAAITMKRPQLIDDQLNRPSGAKRLRKRGLRQSTKLALAGSVTRESLQGVFHTIRSDRRTGTLALLFQEQSCALYFLFGHLFHAASGTLTGEPALKAALAWPASSYTFDAEAPLPTEETILRPIDQVLADLQS
jgi:uncharacterized protein DUF4388